MIRLTQLKTSHFDEVLALICDRYAALHSHIPLLPSRYKDKDVVAPLLASIIENAHGVVAFIAGQLVGFIGGWNLSDFRGRSAVISPEWGNATQHEHSRRIYGEMYGYIAKEWLLQDYYTHIICQYADRSEDITAWHWLGFGMGAADGVRAMHALNKNASRIDIKRAGVDDAQEVLTLARALSRHLSASPTFLYAEHDTSLDHIRNLLADPAQVFWVAYDQHNAVGFLRHGPASDDASTIIVDPGTTSIRGLYTNPQERGRGIAADLLNRALTWSQKQGYERCCVDFEPMNILAARFWTRYFQTSSYAMIRNIDTRISPVGH